MRTELIQF